MASCVSEPCSWSCPRSSRTERCLHSSRLACVSLTWSAGVSGRGGRFFLALTVLCPFSSVMLFQVCLCVRAFCVGMVTGHAWCLQPSEEDLRSSGIIVTDDCEPPCQCWGPNLGLLGGAAGAITTSTSPALAVSTLACSPCLVLPVWGRVGLANSSMESYRMALSHTEVMG